MATQRSKKIKSVHVPAVFLWAAGYKAMAHGQEEDVKRVKQILLKSIGHPRTSVSYIADRETHYFKSAQSFLNKGAIPFHRDEMDLMFAALVFGQGVQFILRSDQSKVEPGFLRASHIEITYVDLASGMIRTDAGLVEFLKAESKETFLKMLDGLNKVPAFYHAHQAGDDVLKITAHPDLVKAVAIKQHCAISLWNGPHASDGRAVLGQLNRKLGHATLQERDDSLFVSGLSAQSKMELTAASLVGKWLLVEADDFRSFGPLPDLTEEDQFRKVAVDPMPVTKIFTLGQTPTVSVDGELVNYFSQKYPWFVPEDSQIWLEAI